MAQEKLQLKKDRLEEVDVARGIVVLLVVLGHLVYYQGIFYKIIYAFHMPFFFIVSGYCSKLHRGEIPFFRYLGSHIKSLLLPTFLFRIIMMILGIYVCNTKEDVLNNLFFSYAMDWFCPALFFSGIVLYVYHRLLEEGEDILQWPIELLSSISQLFIVGATPELIQLYTEKVLPRGGGGGNTIFKWDSCFIAFSFVLIGYHFRQIHLIDHLKKIMADRNPNTTHMLLLLFVAAVPLIYVNTYVNVYDASFGRSDILFYTLASFLSVMCLAAAFYISQISCLKKVKNGLILLGQHGLFIYFGHGILFQLYHKLLLGIGNLDWWPLAAPFSGVNLLLKAGYFMSGIIILLLSLKVIHVIKGYLRKGLQRTEKS